MTKIDGNDQQDIQLWPEKRYSQAEVDDLLKAKTVTTSDSTKQTQQKNATTQAVADLVKKSKRVLVSISSHAFPFDFFPSTINVDEGRLTIITRRLFSSDVYSVDIENISNVFINMTVFFSQLVIISNTFEENEIKIPNLRTKDAIFARKIIEGLRTFVSNKIDTSSFTKEELIAKLIEINTKQMVT